jgi:hypothetical protein
LCIDYIVYVSIKRFILRIKKKIRGRERQKLIPSQSCPEIVSRQVAAVDGEHWLDPLEYES